MSLKKLPEVPEIEGSEGTKIRQIFHPHNTLSGIRYSVAHFSLDRGKKSQLHKIKSSEIYYILEGQGILYVDDDKIQVSKDDSVYIPPMSKQYIENVGNAKLKLLCIVDPAWRKEDESLLE